MKIDKSSWHYKLWRKSFEDKWRVPEETDLCRYCHRVFWQVLGIAALAGMVLVCIGCLLGLLGMFLYKGLWQNTGVTLTVLAIGGAIIGLIVLYVKWLKGGPKKQNTTLLGSWASARKQQVCPLVEFTDEDDYNY